LVYGTAPSFRPGVSCCYCIDGEQEYTSAIKILLEMGELFQIQDDLNLTSATDKIGIDIQDNKCNWLFSVFIGSYLRTAPGPTGELWQRNAELVQVKALYQELYLPTMFMQYEENSQNCLMSLIEQHAMSLPLSICLGLAHKIY
ncbi:LOW QUALITY PROTEIN: Farnesyl pyrophosphate synthase, partial [Galemys pyrenaicus]